MSILDPAQPSVATAPSVPSTTSSARPTPVRPSAVPTKPLAEIVGADLEVPLVPRGTARLVHLDYAASAPPLRAVADTVAEFLPWYASVHRGAGFPSTVSSEALEQARGDVRRFLGARADDVVIFTRNTTDSLNLLAGAIPADTTVLTLDFEHHANLLPWRSGTVVHLPTPSTPAEIPAVFDAALSRVGTEHAVVAVTGAGNVTGEVLPIAEIAAVAHRHGARVVLDAAQLAPHRRIDLSELDVDYVAFSGHKLYAPYGAGVLVGRADWLDQADPYLAGGGAVGRVTAHDASWLASPARHEAGTPNVLGAVAIAAACRALETIGFERIEAHDAALTNYLIDGLRADDFAAVGGPDRFAAHQILTAFPAETAGETGTGDRVGIVAILLDSAASVAAALSAEHGIATRDGAFCAHPLLRRLAGVDPGAPVPNALRASLGLGTTGTDIERFVDALRSITRQGPRHTYALTNGRLVPTPDPRARPTRASTGN